MLVSGDYLGGSMSEKLTKDVVVTIFQKLIQDWADECLKEEEIETTPVEDVLESLLGYLSAWFLRVIPNKETLH